MRRLPLAVVVGILACFALGSAPAGAAFRHPNITDSFGSDGTSGTTIPGGINQLALDQASHRLYAFGPSPSKIYAFDLSGSGGHASLTGTFPLTVNSGGGVPDLAVDSGNGNIYFLSESTGLYGFTSGGAALAGLSPKGGFGDPCGVTVDNAGHPWVGDYGTFSVKGFDSAGNALGAPSPIDVTATGRPCHVEFNRANNDLYVANYNGAVYKYTAASNYTVHTQVDPSTATGLAVDSVRGVVYVAHGNRVDAYSTSSDALLEEFGAEGGHSWSGVEVDESNATVYLADNSNFQIRVLPGANFPSIVTGAASNVLRSSATLSGNADPDGAGDIVSCHFDYGVDTSYGSGTAACLNDSDVVVGTVANPITAPTAVHADVTSLSPATTYHYHLVGGTASQSAPGGDVSFTTPSAVADVTTGTATEVTKFGATVNGSYTGDGVETYYYFQYGPDTNYGQTTAPPPGISNGTSTGTQNVSAELGDLVANTTYHYRLVAHNSFGDNFGIDHTFVTSPPDLPVVDSTSASGVGKESATLNATIKPGYGPTVYRFEYGPSTSYGSRTYPGGPLEADDQDHTASTGISELSPATTYHFRVLATNFAGTTFGPDEAFTTPGSPVINGATASSITTSSAIINARVNPSLSPTSFHVEFGSTAAYGSGTLESASIGDDNSTHSVAATLSGLSTGTVYHYRVVATNAVATTHGSDQIFTTATVPAVTVPPVVCAHGYRMKRGKCVKTRRKHRKHGHHHKRGGRHG
jgi:phosphodiesterase/alkaline phosphatase D-like protein